MNGTRIATLAALAALAALSACASDAPPGGGTPTGQCAEQCASIGWCRPDGILCVPTEEGCKASLRCKTDGHCTHDPMQGECVIDDAGCAASDACIDDGFCCASKFWCAPCK